MVLAILSIFVCKGEWGGGGGGVGRDGKKGLMEEIPVQNNSL